MSDSNDHTGHDVVSSNEEFGYNKANEGILYCRTCEEEFVPEEE